jgi:predicted nucleic acid-binding protein
MKYVLDASVAIKIVLPEVDSDKAVALIDDYRNGVHELIAPDTLLIEVAHALTRAERRNMIPVGRAGQDLLKFFAVRIVLHDYVLLLERAVEISSQKRMGVYDALYLALAEQEQCELVTADARLVNGLPGFPIKALGSLP